MQGGAVRNDRSLGESLDGVGEGAPYERHDVGGELDPAAGAAAAPCHVISAGRGRDFSGGGLLLRHRQQRDELLLLRRLMAGGLGVLLGRPCLTPRHAKQQFSWANRRCSRHVGGGCRSGHAEEQLELCKKAKQAGQSVTMLEAAAFLGTLRSSSELRKKANDNKGEEERETEV